jgi:hypothetical protein
VQVSAWWDWISLEAAIDQPLSHFAAWYTARLAKKVREVSFG